MVSIVITMVPIEMILVVEKIFVIATLHIGVIQWSVFCVMKNFKIILIK